MISVTKAYLPDCKTLYVSGDDETSLDFYFIENVMQINILEVAARANAKSHVYNVALGEKTTLIPLSGALNRFGRIQRHLRKVAQLSRLPRRGLAPFPGGDQQGKGTVGA